MMEPSLRSPSSRPDREALLETAKASPRLAGQHDKDRWLALYSADAVLEDPVGTPPSHKGKRPGRLGDELGRFYEAFIAPSEIEIVSRRDVVSGMHVFRAVDIHTKSSKTGLKMKVPANLLYEIVCDAEGRLAIRRMQAHWELNRMSRILMSEGLLGMRTIATMNWSMLRAFGPKWLLSYFQTSQQGVGRKGKELIERMAREVGRDGSDFFADDATVELPGAATASIAEFLEGCTALEVEDLLASGRTVSGLASLEWGGRPREAAFVAELDAEATRVRRLRWFWED
ncbi:MAG TPA: nuclear transport factor 2 family protein [Polyangiales bacterium]|nr:nuclear transport factor 2 family protein [Polyangiales bacterium]